jgi:glycosyltransferase involved in cell wall biosynthesis
LCHILYAENHAQFWKDYPSSLHSRTILTFHQPSSRWPKHFHQSVQWVRHAILLYTRDYTDFQTIMPQANIHVIRHGVDVSFFKPAPGLMHTLSPPHLRLLYNGVHLRNTEMLRRVVLSILHLFPSIHFDFLVPVHRRNTSVFGDLLEHPRITWHAGLNNQQLLSLYQNAYALLLPMNDSGANTAVVEALACGLPVITTDVGGIRDYGGGSVFPVVANNDDDAMIALVHEFIQNQEWRDVMSAKVRHYAVNHLAWPVVAQQHVAVYQSL